MNNENNNTQPQNNTQVPVNQINQNANVTQSTTPVVSTQQVQQPIQAPQQPVQSAIVQQPVQAPQQPVQTAVVQQPVQAPQQPVQPSVAQQPVQAPQQPVQPSVAQQPVQAPQQPVQPSVAQQPVQAPQPVQATVSSQAINAPVNSEALTTVSDVSGDNLGANFISTAKPLKKRMKPIFKGIIISLIIVIVALVGYFVLYPLAVKNVFNNSKKIFDATIDVVTKDVNSYIDDWYSNRGIIDGSLTIDSNYDKLKDYSGYTYGARIGIDSEIKDLEFGYNVIDSNKNDYSQVYYVKNNDLYVRYSNYRDLIYLGSMKDSKIYNLYNTIYSNLNSLDKVEKNNVIYIVNKISNSFKSTITDKKIDKTEDTINVNGQSIKVIKSSYVMDKNTITSTKDTIVNDLVNDEQVLETLSNILGQEKDEIKEYLRNIELDIEDDYQFTINIYTSGIKAEFHGIEVFDNKNNISVHYFKNNDDFEIKASGNSIKDIVVLGVKKDGKENVTITYDSKELATLVVNKWDVNNKSFDYTIKKDDQEVTGNLDIQYNKSNLKNELKIDLKMNMNKYYINVGFVLNDDQNSKIANINAGASKMISDEELNVVITQFNQLINSTPLGNLFKTSFGINDPSINNSNSIIKDILNAVDNTPKPIVVEEQPQPAETE